jgi:kynurenine formamidase
MKTGWQKKWQKKNQQVETCWLSWEVGELD